jgi:hypothetical protein
MNLVRLGKSTLDANISKLDENRQKTYFSRVYDFRYCASETNGELLIDLICMGFGSMLDYYKVNGLLGENTKYT